MLPSLFPAARLGHPLLEEKVLVEAMLEHYPLSTAQIRETQALAEEWVKALRTETPRFLALDSLLKEYPLTTEEGLALMQLAESVLRVPDIPTLDALITDKLHDHAWITHTDSSHSLLGRTSGWGAWLADQILAPRPDHPILQGVLHRLGEPTIRRAVAFSIKQIAQQFIVGETIEEAVSLSLSYSKRHERYSFDVLGEGARTDAQAQHYVEAYRHAIRCLAQQHEGQSPEEGHSISIKLSALHPRYEWLHFPKAIDELYSRLLILAQDSLYYGISLTLDAEESDRLELSLILVERLLEEPSLRAWNGLGLAVQAYGKRILPLIDHLIHLAKEHERRLAVRLVKGAYWDSEIKRAQEQGLSDYPVFTRKSHTDLAYLCAAEKLLQARGVLFPQFATHNALTIAQILSMAGTHPGGFEFQRLHGMGESVYALLRKHCAIPCRVYAPVGLHRDLLAYLVRRLLENGSNSSFVHQLADTTLPIDRLLRDPKHLITTPSSSGYTPLCKPSELYGNERRNAAGVWLGDPDSLTHCYRSLLKHQHPIQATCLINGKNEGALKTLLTSPADQRDVIGTALCLDDPALLQQAFQSAHQHQAQWDQRPVQERAQCLERFADLLEERQALLLSLLIREAGKTLADAVAEIREAVDFCRYYAAQARALFLPEGQTLKGPTGELNRLVLRGRGVWVCISPWNFPLAIFVGQISAALVSGNAVIAKPAEATPLIAYTVCQWWFEAGIPKTLLHLILGSGKKWGSHLLQAPQLAGVAFTGSTQTARWMNQTLAAREGAIIPFIAETGGQNAMIVDSTAVLEQSCDAIIQSAFRSAGQRCSALRLLWIQEDIAQEAIQMLTGAMNALTVGCPLNPSTDVGPVIHSDARNHIVDHIHLLEQTATVLHRTPVPADQEQILQHGAFVRPHLIEIEEASELTEEVFGPVLHLIRFKAEDWPRLFETINHLGYGLTFGLHTRINHRIQEAIQGLHVGNLYINRSMTGAVVGVQPFGGEGLSGTGPKAGGPHYLLRFAVERTLSINLMASGGNIALMNQME
jgi:RHH-type transcriptional regulator, proline utilization regulon repressor / proline dehydrogenase / delta 1-pyrroline-5-carboxylate dehydrogenase